MRSLRLALCLCARISLFSSMQILTLLSKDRHDMFVGDASGNSLEIGPWLLHTSPPPADLAAIAVAPSEARIMPQQRNLQVDVPCTADPLRSLCTSQAQPERDQVRMLQPARNLRHEPEPEPTPVRWLLPQPASMPTAQLSEPQPAPSRGLEPDPTPVYSLQPGSPRMRTFHHEDGVARSIQHETAPMRSLQPRPVQARNPQPEISPFYSRSPEPATHSQVEDLPRRPNRAPAAAPVDCEEQEEEEACAGNDDEMVGSDGQTSSEAAPVGEGGSSPVIVRSPPCDDKSTSDTSSQSPSSSASPPPAQARSKRTVSWTRTPVNSKKKQLIPPSLSKKTCLTPTSAPQLVRGTTRGKPGKAAVLDSSTPRSRVVVVAAVPSSAPAAARLLKRPRIAVADERFATKVAKVGRAVGIATGPPREGDVSVSRGDGVELVDAAITAEQVRSHTCARGRR